MSRYERSEHTGIESIDREIDTLRSERDEAAQKQYEAQSKIDKLFLDSMMPDIKCGDYIYYEKDDRITTGRVIDLRRVFGGVTIEFDIVAFIPVSGINEGTNKEITIVHCSGYSVSVKKDDLPRVKKITREQFIGYARANFENIMKATKDIAKGIESATQLKLNI
jgi:hypothetical protein